MHLTLPLPYALRLASTPQGGEARPPIRQLWRGGEAPQRARRVAQCPAAAAAAAADADAASAAAAAASAAGVIVATAAAGTAAATATATHCPWFAFARGLFGLGVPSGSDARISAAIGRPTTNGPTALSAAPRRASRAYVH